MPHCFQPPSQPPLDVIQIRQCPKQNWETQCWAVYGGAHLESYKSDRWYTLVKLGRLSQEDQEIKANLSYIVNSRPASAIEQKNCFKINKKKTYPVHLDVVSTLISQARHPTSGVLNVWGCGLLVQHLASVHKALGSNPTKTKQQQTPKISLATKCYWWLKFSSIYSVTHSTNISIHYMLSTEIALLSL